MTARDLVGYLTLLASAVAGVSIYWYIYLAPIPVTVSVAPPDSEASRFFEAFRESSAREGLRVRISLLPRENATETVEAFEEERADFAFARPDVRLPSSGLAVAILHHNVAALIGCVAAAPPARSRATQPPLRGVNAMAELRGRKVAILGRGPGNQSLFETLAELSGVPPAEIQMQHVASPQDIEQAAGRGLDALFLNLPRGDVAFERALRSMRCGAGLQAKALPLPEATALASRNRVFSSVELQPGDLAANPQTPSEAITTLGFPTVLIARRDLPEATVEAFTRQLFTLRHTLAPRNPAASRIEALPTDRGSAFALHPGAARFYDAEERTFFERYEVLLYILLFGFGGLASALVWFARKLFPHREQLAMEEHDSFAALISEARTADSTVGLEEVESKLDALISQLSERMLKGEVDLDLKPAYDMLTERAEEAIAARRADLRQAAQGAA